VPHGGQGRSGLNGPTEIRRSRSPLSHLAETRNTTDINGPLVIAGAAGGIGMAVAALAVDAAVAVALLDRDEARLTAAAAELGSGGRGGSVEVVPIACDVTDERAVEAAFDSASDRLGPARAVVAAAGIDRGARIDELAAPVWDEVIAVNLRGTFLTCRAAVRRMLASGTGSIVCVSSPLAFVATAGGSGAYSASKGGVSALVRSLAVDHAPDGIRVNALLPGPTETDLMWANTAAEEEDRLREVIRSEVPLARLADPTEIARAAMWLLSEGASYITGAQVPCDGGVLAKASVSV
jgi:NAD(P)-dependent dehydrogenase (short-subunit alcohol dehydrogenase family)